MAVFTFVSRVDYQELDTFGVLHNARHSLHVERAIVAFYEERLAPWLLNAVHNPDYFQVVKRFEIEFCRPFIGMGACRVDLRVNKLGATSCVYGFECLSTDAAIKFAFGTRVIVKTDPDSFEKKPWTSRFRTEHARLLEPGQLGTEVVEPG